MTPRARIDTGAIIALLDRDDEWHARMRNAWSGLPLPVATSDAVLTELFHVLEPREHPSAWRLLRSGAIVILPIDAGDLPEIEALMDKYRDLPMDFADACLVRLGRRERLTTILTVDSDFQVYRLEGRRRLTVLPPR